MAFMNEYVPENGKVSVKVVVATRKEMIAAFEETCECFLCQSELMADEKMYYIPVLDVVYCKRCFDFWLSTAVTYKVDLPKEKRNLDKIIDKFKEIGCLDEDWNWGQE